MLTSGFAWRSILFCASICTLSAIPQLPSLTDSGNQRKQVLLSQCTDCDVLQDQAKPQKLSALAEQNKQGVLLALQANHNLAQAGKMP